MVEQGIPTVTHTEMLAEGSITTDGTEQTIIEAKGESPFSLSAWIDLTNMEVGDTITIRQFIKMKEGGGWVQYAEKSYSGKKKSPALFITTKPATYGIKITLKENTGEHGILDYNVFRQRSVVDRGSIVFTS